MSYYQKYIMQAQYANCLQKTYYFWMELQYSVVFQQKKKAHIWIRPLCERQISGRTKCRGKLVAEENRVGSVKDGVEEEYCTGQGCSPYNRQFRNAKSRKVHFRGIRPEDKKREFLTSITFFSHFLSGSYLSRISLSRVYCFLVRIGS